ncbi:MAG: acetylglutamate kinase [Fibrobacterota bacterium]
MKKLIEKTKILLEALPYLQEFRRKTFVVKFGGSAMEKPDIISSVLRDIVFLENVGVRVIVVHGGGKAISAELRKKNIEPSFQGGLRVTDKKTIKIVEDVLVNKVNKHIAETIKKLGGDSVGISAADHGILEASRLYHYEKSNGRRKRIDIGYVGKITKMRTHPLYRILNAEKIPVIAPLALGKDGFVYNVNADTAACEIAGRLKAEKLIFLSDVDGVYGKSKKLVPTLKTSEVSDYVKKGVISGGMIPKVESMASAVRRGVHKTHIINGKIPHSLLLEIYTDSGIGTEFIK